MMRCVYDDAASRRSLVLAGEILVSNVAQAKASLIEQCGAISPGKVHVDLMGVEAVDAAGLQLLISFQRHLAKKGVRLALSACSSVLSESALLLGIDVWKM